ncbi:isocitrate lyase/phosphoenolpyruvate mutase family protein [Horticoccus luteus]|uniref:Isocitrate lyase/phosphoenolpyruvate mutase family protein n=1 Tax=Horticoccus luteus TaxID=2862869 RepID=A0A8F9TUW8_9BACT|nr:isocitrate lyase/phosphoenolpyruvate mutase family protein [Horticoccus luteus]QYM78733.1 isocitrate lyase/phosphoenolpyruvate mutase family protein [Horticoccus luteus]
MAHQDSEQAVHARAFSALHVKGNPVVLYNIWDAGSAKAVRAAGAKAIATGSRSVAAAQGFEDGEKVPLELVVTLLKRIVASVDVPVTLDFEGGYGRAAETVQENVARVVGAGAVGINFEDQIVGGTGLYSIEEQSARVRAARAGADAAGVRAFLNARIDLFLKNPPEAHNDALVAEALQRGEAYAAAGADGLFYPGLVDPRLIGVVCARAPRPVNILAKPGAPSKAELAQLGVARISHGPFPYNAMAAALQEAAKKVLAE